MRKYLILLLLGLLVVGGAGGYWQWQRWHEANRRLEFIVPPGTVDRIAAGETVDVLPLTIEMKLDNKDILVIRNDDSQTVQIGPYKIEPGQQFRQQYFNAGTFDLVCSIHKGQQLRIVVTR